MAKSTPETTLSFSRDDLTRLITLCDARAHNLRKFVDENPDDDDVSDALDDISDLKSLATKMRDTRGREAALKAARDRCFQLREAAHNLLRHATIHPDRADACIVSRERLGALRNALLGPAITGVMHAE